MAVGRLMAVTPLTFPLGTFTPITPLWCLASLKAACSPVNYLHLVL